MFLRSKKLYISFLLITWLQFTSSGQASFTATISPSSIGKDETAELRLLVDNARQVDQITPPILKDFIILSGPNQETGMESNNGVTRQYIGITYILKPRTPGRFTIGSAVAKADGKSLRSNSLQLEVTKNSSPNAQNNSSTGLAGLSPFRDPMIEPSFNDFIIKKGENITDKINKNIFIRVNVSQSSCYVGEPIVVTYKLYTRLKSESSITKNPSFNGFSVIDLLPPGNTYYSMEKLNGREYNVYTLRKSQLYPLQPGPVELESAEVENNIHFIKDEYIHDNLYELPDLFRDFAQTTIPSEGIQDEKVTLQSKPTLVTVKALPEKDKSPLFRGAVGNFIIEASLEKTTVNTDDAARLSVAVKGAGNMSLIIAPEVNWPAGIEPYEPKAKEDLNKLVVPVSGTKLFEYPFTIAKPGRYNIPPVTFSFFDVKQGTYKTVSSGPLSIQVTKGTGKRALALKQGDGTNDKVTLVDIIFTNRWLIIVPLGVLMMAGLFTWLYKDNKRQANRQNSVVKLAAPVVPAVQLPVNPLEVSGRYLAGEDSRAFYGALNHDVKTLLSEKLEIPFSNITKRNIVTEAGKKGIPESTSLQIQQLLEDIEWQLYTPLASGEKMEEMYYMAGVIIEELKTTIP